MIPFALLITVTLWHGQPIAQKLPEPSRSVYKCEQAGKIVYSDAPCLGATRIDIQPTRGLNKSTGTEQIGKDVRHEQQREMMAEALHPLTGMDARQLDRSGRRMKLSPEAQKVCKNLDQEMPGLERRERALRDAELAALQRELLAKRSIFHNGGCE